ncbi:hypothetical protein [Streptomyces sp. NBC_00878]|uniref:hypothetical protein n=1 Tax=Streptomyces sp. NBC_00878 TaxID=2975854 RepID=UPI00225C14D8|nr:hypothetical protein [Streptomyces sp. NBC_00878]MCX4904835.1 hypothetical protein [Streptomyces sp. NBC_00878]
MDPILERIGARRAYLADQVELLGKQLTDAEAELARVVSAEQVVGQLPAEDEAAGEENPAMVGGAEPGRVLPYRKDAAGLGDLSADYQRVPAEVAEAGAPVRCKQLCEPLIKSSRMRRATPEHRPAGSGDTTRGRSRCPCCWRP